MLLFWLALRAMIQADRRERAAEAKWDREHGLVGAGGVADGAGAGEAPGDAGGSGGAGPGATGAGNTPPVLADGVGAVSGSADGIGGVGPTPSATSTRGDDDDDGGVSWRG